VGLNLILICALCAQVATSQAPAKEAATYVESDAGFQTQFRAIFHARCSGDTASEQRLLEQLKIPDSAGWFAQNFDPGEPANLTERYERLFSDYRDSIEKPSKALARPRAKKIAVNHTNAPGEHMRVAQGFQLSTTRPLIDLPLARFRFAMRLRGQDKGSWAETFVYEQRAFRFIGLGTCHSGVGSKGPAQPLTRTAYSPAHGADLPGSAGLSDDGEGEPHRRSCDAAGRSSTKKEKVKTLELIQGDPLLVDAAMAAVKRWRYNSVIVAGNPTEADTIVSVVFQLRKN